MKYAVGLMSGTSLDGVDVALVKIKGSGIDTSVQLIDFMTVAFADDERRKIMAHSAVMTSNVRDICSLNFELGYKFADAVKVICEKSGIALADLDFIGSHGKTIYHQPVAEDGFFASALQIGEPSVIAYETNTLVVSNFRTMDMAAGGQGAPLVPYTEWVLYQDVKKSRLLQNIGGIGNVTIMPPNAKLEDVIAFDTGPGNMVIDALCIQLFGVDYDLFGKLAARGQVDEKLLDECLQTPYILASPPKTTGRELFGKAFVGDLLNRYKSMNKYDLLATLTMFTAKSIELNYRKFVFPHYDIDEVVVSGGGSYNKTLMDMLANLLNRDCLVLTSEDIGHSSEAKEAVAFAILANETINGNSCNVLGATGAKDAVV